MHAHSVSCHATYPHAMVHAQTHGVVIAQVKAGFINLEWLIVVEHDLWRKRLEYGLIHRHLALDLQTCCWKISTLDVSLVARTMHVPDA